MSSFMDIKDHEKRDAIISDYISTIKRIQQRNEDDKIGSLAHQRDLEDTWRPVIQSQEQVTKKITKELEPIKEGVLNLRESLREREIVM